MPTAVAILVSISVAVGVVLLAAIKYPLIVIAAISAIFLYFAVQGVLR